MESFLESAHTHTPCVTVYLRVWVCVVLLNGGGRVKNKQRRNNNFLMDCFSKGSKEHKWDQKKTFRQLLSGVFDSRK